MYPLEKRKITILFPVHFRNQTLTDFADIYHRRLREIEEHLRSKQEHDKHESHELKWAGEKDAEA